MGHLKISPAASKHLALQAIKSLITHAGDDATREGLIDTPSRVIASYATIYGGYKFTERHVAKLLKTFEDGACDEMVVLSNVEFYSTCEHHLQPFFGQAHIGYLPHKRVVGLSKLARLLEVYARRMQIQERIGTQVVEALMKYLKPHGAACVLQAKHFCMLCRGVQKQNSIMTTSCLRGEFMQPEVRAEFLKLIELSKT